jgi:L-rhamnose-H+ transport protein
VGRAYHKFYLVPCFKYPQPVVYDYTDGKSPLTANYLFSALAGTTWYLQFFFYGMGESKLGNGASSWILHMAFIILVSNMWGCF